MVRSSDVPPVIIIITRDTSATPALQRARTNPGQKKKNLASPCPSPSPSSSSCLNAHIHSHTLRQSPLGIMIMKEMQCVSLRGVFVLHGGFDVKLRKRKGKAERESDIFMLDGNPLSNVKKMIPLSLNRLYLEDAPHVGCLCACAFIHTCAGDVLRRERSCSRIPLDGTG